MARVYIYGEAERFRNYSRVIAAVGGCAQFGGDPDACDGLLLPGGGDVEPWRYGQENTASRGLEPERDREEMDLLDRFIQQGKPVLGICRGIQVINVYFGGTLIQDLPGHHQVNGLDRFHYTRTSSPLLRDICGKNGIVNSAHHQAIDRLGSGLEAVQWAPDGVVEAVRHQRFPVWGVQWHPERMPEWLAVNLLAFFGPYSSEKNIQNL